MYTSIISSTTVAMLATSNIINPILIALIPSLIVAYFVSQWTIKNALNHFYSTKWWEIRIAKYQDVLNVIFDYRILNDQFDTTLVINGLSSSDLSVAADKLDKCVATIFKLAALSSLYMSKDASRKLDIFVSQIKVKTKEYEKKISENSTNPLNREFVTYLIEKQKQEKSFIEDTLNDLIVIAKKDLMKCTNTNANH